MERGASTRTGDAAGAFTQYFRGLAAALGASPGWYAVFARRDPDAARDYFEGADVPPWDVVRALIHDVAAVRGGHVGDGVLVPARRLHAAAVAAHDAAPGSEHALRARLDLMLRERQYATLRERDLDDALHRAGHDPGRADLVAGELAWARDDRERAAIRCAELQARLDAVLARPAVPEDWFRAPAAPPPAPRVPAPRTGDGAYAPEAAPPPPPPPPPARGRKEGRRGGARYGGARFAGAPEAAAEEPSPAPAPPPDAAHPGPRGARFAGAAEEQPPAGGHEEPGGAEARAHRVAARTAAARMAELRRTGRSGEAYVLMSEAAAGPAEQIPELAAALEQSGLAADVATLLWELAARPPHHLAAVASALDAAGRAEDCRTLLHQAAARPAAEVARTAAALCEARLRDRAVTLLAALVRARTPDTAAAIVAERPDLTGPLLDAAGLVSASRRRDVVAALRRAGLSDRES
ncbi:hypothetical protein ACFWVC_20935 [Streptomyces sp. NPDC058691]|uniref:hypothetical protein n=1 Tax=Streptomyces sp. NPDC058691 TaxID=3346601 RepID=UPI00365A776E